MNKSKKNKKIFGISIIEALVSTAIIGIGFVAILQMTNYSVQSIQTSGERTKANYLTNVIAEDVLSIKKATTGSFSNFSNYLLSNEFNADACSSTTGTASSDTGKVYGDTNADAPLMKMRKWKALLNNKDYLNCAGRNETRNFRVFKVISRWSQVDGLVNAQQTDIDNNGSVDQPYVMDEVMYIGRVQFNLNNGKKRKFLYFQSDFELKQ